MLSLYKKNEIAFSVVLIIIYVVGASVCDSFSDRLGFSKIFTLPFFIIFSAVLFIFLGKQNLFNEYGICKTELPLKKMLYFIPLIFLCLLNIYPSVSFSKNVAVIIIESLSMLFVGFLEEIIFRGFLFKAMAKNNLKLSVAVSSLTFGIGHIVNLFNGAEIIPTICQIIGAVGFGFMCVMIFIKSKSLLPCIITHSVFNILSIFASEADMMTYIIISFIMFVVTVAYSVFISLQHSKNNV